MHQALMTPQRATLLQARKAYSKCAARLEGQIRLSGLSQDLSEKIIGIGIAADWVRRAAEMEDILYVGDNLNRSRRKASFVELLRYGFLWFGLNAIFSRPALLNVIGPPAGKSEYDAFLVLFSAPPLPNAKTMEKDLHSLLSAKTSPRLPGSPSGTIVSTLKAIDLKYVPKGKLHGKTAKALAAAASSGNVAALDLPTLLYGFRNWSVHGNALDGSFGSKPRFRQYLSILQQALAEVHLNTAETLRSKL